MDKGSSKGLLTTTAGGVDYKEGKRISRSKGSKTEELNWYQTPDQDQNRSPDRILVDLPPIFLPNPHRCLV